MKKSETTTVPTSLERTGIFKIILLSLVLASIVVYTFLTDYFPKDSKSFLNHEPKYSLLIKERNNNLKRVIKGSEVEDSVFYVMKSSGNEIKQYNLKFDELQLDHYFLGYTSFSNFLLGTSPWIFCFTLCLFILHLIIKYVKIKILRSWYLGLSFVSIVTSGYWLAWSFLSFSLDPARKFDFPKSWYNFFVYLLPSIIFFIASFLFKYLKTAEEKRKQLSKKLYHQIIVNNEQYLRLDSVLDYYKDNIEMFANIERKNSTKQLSIFNRLLIFIKKKYGK